MSIEYKECSKCLIKKALTEFHLCSENKDGLHGHCKVCVNQYYRLLYKSNDQRRQQRQAYGKTYKECLRRSAIEHYGGYQCAFCGETISQFLSIDHMNGGGNKHRKSIGAGHFYKWLKNNDYPQGFQILCMNCNCKKSKSWTLENRTKKSIYNREYMLSIKDKVYQAYGGAVCKCCGITEFDFLTIDHVNNDGNIQRRESNDKHRGYGLYLWLVRNNFPLGFQVLCMNCNFGKKINHGVCPHQTMSVINA